MEYKHLLYFKKTAELQHMSKAAIELNISQPFLSRTISELENELGVKLFDHLGRGIVLNENGKVFYRNVLNILNVTEDAKKELNEFACNNNDEITIVSNVGSYLPKLLKSFAIQNPSEKFKVYSLPRMEMINSLIEGKAKFAICCPVISEDPALESCFLMNERGCVLFPSDHWLKNCDRVENSVFVSEPIISVAQGFGTRDVFDMRCKQLGIIPNIIIESTDTSAIPSFVQAGLGIAVAPYSIIKQNPSLKDYHIFKNIDGNISVSVGLTWRKGMYLSSSDKTFIEIAKQYFYNLEKSLDD